VDDRPQGHRWVVDSIEESVASVEIDGNTMMTVPRWLLPADVHQGDALAVRHSRPSGGRRSALTIEIDDQRTRAGLDESAAQVAKTRAAQGSATDPGGDIAL
jgi:hypothetical protein